MVIRLRLLLTLLALIPALLHAAQLSIETDAKQVEMGKYLGARIVHIGEQSAGTADLRQWHDDFHVDRRGSETDTLPNGQIQTTEYLRLYPKRTGELLLESIALGGAIASPQRIHSKPAVREGIDGTPYWRNLPEQVWQGQAFDVAILMNLMHPSNHIAAEEMTAPGWRIKELPRIEEVDERGKSVNLRWRLQAHSSGHLTIDPPPIEQRGRGRWRFHLPSHVVKVLPLPSYLPPTVPVGTIELTPSLVEDSGTQYWQLQVSGEGELPDEIHGVRLQLAAIANSETGQITMQSRASSKNGTTHLYRAPIPDWSWGFGKGPQVAIEYFDTVAGRLALVETNLPSIWRVPNSARVGLGLLGLALTAVLGAAIWRVARKMIIRRRFIRKLQRASDPDQMRTLLLLSAEAKSLSEWQASVSTNAPPDIAPLLNQLCFSPDRQRTVLATLKRVKNGLRHAQGGAPYKPPR